MLYKTYKFALYNWKNGFTKMWLYHDFPNAYVASKHADRISFNNKGSSYFLIFQPGAETPVKGNTKTGWRRSA